jgi:hypothetical protein
LRQKEAFVANELLAIAQEQVQQFLEPDEHVLAAFQAQPRGAGVAKSGAGPAVSAIGGKWSGKSRDSAAGAGLQLTSPMALALTERRVVVFGGKAGGMSGKIKEITELVSSAPLSEIDSIQVKGLLVGKTVSIAMNGGEVKLEVPGGQDPKGFAAEFDKAKAAG